MTLAEAIALVEELHEQSPRPRTWTREFETEQKRRDALLLVLDAAKHHDELMQRLLTPLVTPRSGFYAPPPMPYQVTI